MKKIYYLIESFHLHTLPVDLSSLYANTYETMKFIIQLSLKTKIRNKLYTSVEDQLNVLFCMCLHEFY